MSAKVAITIVAQCARKTACFSIVDGAGKVYVPVAADHKNQNTNLTFALPVSFPAVRRRILNAINAGSGEKAWVKTLPLV